MLKDDRHTLNNVESTSNPIIPEQLQSLKFVVSEIDSIDYQIEYLAMKGSITTL